MTAARLTPMARRDIGDSMNWIAKDNPRAARALLDTVERAAIAIGEHPEIGTLRPEIVGAPYRCFSLTGFPYVIVYNSARRPPLIVRVLHGARDLPGVLRDL